MILRKPYAFLIKKFKLIHLIMLLLMLYTIYNSYNLFNYFSELVETNNNTQVLTSTLINMWMFIVSILIIVFSIIIFLLMRFKKKPKVFYLTTIICYIFYIVVLSISFSDLRVLEYTVLETRAVRLIRDLSLITIIYQLIIIVMTLIRALGFDIRKFNFLEDVNELNIDVDDNEEFELSMGIDTNKIIRKTRRKKREFKYFLLEHKVSIFIVVFLLIISISGYILLNKYVYNRIYQENDLFRTTNYIMKVNNTYLTDYSYGKKNISLNNTSYVVINIDIKSIYEGKTLKLNNFSLITENKTYTPETKQCSNLYDFGYCYKNTVLEKDKNNNYILIFNIDDQDNDSKMILRYRDRLVYKPGELEATYQKVSLKPQNVDKIKLLDTKNINEELNFNTSIINGKVNISSFTYESRYYYTYKSCTSEDNCQDYSSIIIANTMYNKTLLELTLNLEIDKSIDKGKFIADYGKIIYTIDDKEYSSNITNKTPDNYQGENTYVEVNSGINTADTIYLELTLRDKAYRIKLKGNE